MLDLVAALYLVAHGQQARYFEELVNVKYYHSPAVDIEVEGHLQRKPILGGHLFVEV